MVFCMTYLIGLSFALLTGLVVIFGDVVIKHRRGPQRSRHRRGCWSLGCLIYAASAVLWFWAMRHTTLAQAGVAYSMFTLLALALIGAVWFKETLAMRELGRDRLRARLDGADGPVRVTGVVVIGCPLG